MRIRKFFKTYPRFTFWSSFSGFFMLGLLLVHLLFKLPLNFELGLFNAAVWAVYLLGDYLFHKFKRHK